MTWKPDTLNRDQYRKARDRRIERVCSDVNDEVLRAMDKHGGMNSSHEAFAVILEELEEFWEEVKKKEPDPLRMAEELTQTAAMCVRAIVDLDLSC